MELNTLIILLSFAFIFGVVMYAMLDGFDLGVGNVFLFFDKSDRAKMMDTIAPVWDGNETWLLYAGTIALAAFPIMFYGILPAIYVPAVLMVAGLFVRSISFEYRLKAQGGDKQLWDFTFFLGSFLASFLQGMLLGASFTSLRIENGVFLGGQFDFLSPFTVLTGVLTVVVYSLLGLSYLRYKTDGNIAQKATAFIKPLVVISFIGTFVVEYSLISLFEPLKMQVLGNSIRVIAIIVLSVLSVLVFLWVLKTLKSPHHNISTFLSVVALFALSLVKKVFMFWPFAVFPTYTIFQASNSEPALRFTFWLVIIFLPLVLIYTIFVYYTFKGKLKKEEQFYS